MFLAGIEKDRPFDDLGFNENAAASPWIVTKQLRRLGQAASLHDEESPTAIRVRTGQDNPPLFEQAIDERCMLVPERLLPSWPAWHPRRARISKHEEKRSHITFHRTGLIGFEVAKTSRLSE